MSTAPADRKSGEQGFTIAESLVALAVFALAGVALAQMQTQSVRTFSRVETRALGRIVAENALVDEMARQDAPALGEREGQTDLAGKRWRWRLAIAPTADSRTLRVEAKAFAPDDQAPAASITAFKTVGAAR